MMHKSNQNGFSLIELTLVLAIVAGVLVAGLDLLGGQSKVGKMDDTKERLVMIQEAIAHYQEKNAGELPCPAPIDAPVSSAAFGVPEDCSVPARADPGQLTHAVSNGGLPQVRIGAVPVQALALSNKYAFDAFGSRLVYAATEDIVNGVDISAGIQLVNDAGVLLQEKKSFVVVSHGPDAQGGYNYDGVQVSSCGGEKDAANCNFSDATFSLAQFNDGNITANRFDDLVVSGTSDIAFVQCLEDEKMVFADGAFGCDKIMPTCANGDLLKQEGSEFVCRNALQEVMNALPVCADQETLRYVASTDTWICGSLVSEVSLGGSCEITAPSGTVFTVEEAATLDIPCNDFNAGTCAVSSATVRYTCVSGVAVQISSSCPCSAVGCSGYGTNPNYCGVGAYPSQGRMSQAACTMTCLSHGASYCMHSNGVCYVCANSAPRRIGGCSGCRLSACSPSINSTNGISSPAPTFASCTIGGATVLHGGSRSVGCTTADCPAGVISGSKTYHCTAGIVTAGANTCNCRFDDPGVGL